MFRSASPCLYDYVCMAAAATFFPYEAATIWGQTHPNSPLKKRQRSHGDVYRNPCATANDLGFGHRRIATPTRGVACRVSSRWDLEVTGEDATKNVIESYLYPLDSWICFVFGWLITDWLNHSKSPIKTTIWGIFVYFSKHLISCKSKDFIGSKRGDCGSNGGSICQTTWCFREFQWCGYCSYTCLPGNHWCSHQLLHVESQCL